MAASHEVHVWKLAVRKTHRRGRGVRWEPAREVTHDARRPRGRFFG